MTSIREILNESRLPRVEARMLLAHAFGHERPAHAHAWLVVRDDTELDADTQARYESLLARRLCGEPVAYLIGSREFYGRDFRCSPAALIPRPETELLVDLALERLPADFAGTILDVGTGTGCIAITLALERVHAKVIALDVSATALALAEDNARALGASNLSFVESNWFAAIGDAATIDMIVSNPPYVVPGDAHLSQGDLRFEPPIALADEVDGLESYRRLAKGAQLHLRPGGWLIVEHGYDQGDTVPALLRAAGFVEVSLQRDLAGQARVTLARLPG